MNNTKLLGVVIVLLSWHWASAQPSNLNVTPTALSVSIGATATFRVTAAGASPFTYQWWFTNAFGDNPIDGVANPSALRNILNLTNVQVAAAGGYHVVVTDTNSLSATSGVANLEVDPTFTKITQGPIVNDRLDSWYGYWGDYDNDGRLDLLINASANHWRLYHNDGRTQDGRTQFSTVTNGVMGEFNLRKMWGVWSDPDNDGDLDVLSDSSGPAMLWNDGQGHFTRVPQNGGWASGPLPLGGVYGSAWGDFDRDGFLDCFSSSTDTYTNAVLHNNGNGTFTWMANSVLTLSADRIQVTAVVDYDNDGDLDLIPIRYGGRRTQFYRNDGQGNFEEATPEPIRSELSHSLTSAWGDFDNDGDLDVFFGAWQNLQERFYVNQGRGTFTAWTGQPALFESYGDTAGSWAGWGDYNNDGFLDLAIAGGNAAVRLWRNRGDGNFDQVLTGSLVNESGSFIQSGCWVDFNQDGNLDLFLATLSGAVDKLYMGNGNGNHWLEVKLKGTASNRLAVGARVFATATVGGKVLRQMRVITASDSDQSLIAHFGLGNATNVTTLRIEWPSGAVQEFVDLAANQMLTLWESPSLSAAMRADGACELSIKAEPNRSWRIKASSDLLTWQTLTTVTHTTVVFQFIDTAAAGMECRFYRVEGE